MDGKRLVLTTSTGNVKAIMLARATKSGVARTRMSWGNSCATVKQDEYVYKRDRSNNDDVNCVVVMAFSNTRQFIDASPALRKDLDGKITDGAGVIYVYIAQSLGSGGYMTTQMLISQDFKGLAGESPENKTKIPMPMVAWALALAESSKGAIGSFSGNWAIPAMLFPD